MHGLHLWEIESRTPYLLMLVVNMFQFSPELIIFFSLVSFSLGNEGHHGRPDLTLHPSPPSPYILYFIGHKKSFSASLATE